MALMNDQTKQEDQAPDFLMDQTVSSAMIADVKEKVKILKLLYAKMLGAEAAYKHAQEEYEHYKATVVIAAMTNTGMTVLQDDEGNFIKLESKYYCQPNKNDEDRLKIQAWLKEQGAEDLFKHEGLVDAAQYKKLEENGIPFADKIDVNTNKLKAWLMDQCGFKKGSVARIALTDIPECIHFDVKQEVIVG